jgi:hypothetical protein
MIPLYGFLQGDTIGLLILADEDDTPKTLADKLASAARVRVNPRAPLRIFYKGRELEADATVARARIEPLDRIDAVEEVQ